MHNGFAKENFWPSYHASRKIFMYLFIWGNLWPHILMGLETVSSQNVDFLTGSNHKFKHLKFATNHFMLWPKPFLDTTGNKIFFITGYKTSSAMEFYNSALIVPWVSYRNFNDKTPF